MKTFTRVFGIGEQVEWRRPGNMFRIISATYPVTVELIQGGSVLDEKAESVDTGFWTIPAGGFEGIRITSAQAQTVVFAISSRESGYDKVFGSVQVTNPEPGADRSIASASYMCGTPLAASPGNYSQHELWNPAGSGKILIVRKVVAACTAAGSVQLGRANTLGAATATNWKNSKNGASSWSASTIYQIAQSAASIINDGLLLSAVVAANAPRVLLDGKDDPIIVPAGKGLCVVGGTLNFDCGAEFHFDERAE